MSKAESHRHQSYLEAAEELRPNPEQWEAYESTGNFVVLAGPGSGKTKVLTTKLARILSEDISEPRGIACITFNNECARELRTRLGSLGVKERQNVFIGTIHSFCLQHLIKPFSHLVEAGLPKDPKVATQARQRHDFLVALEECVPGPTPPDEFRPRFDRHRRGVLDRSSSEWKELDEEAAAVIERYEELLRADCLIDFDDMVLVGRQLLQNLDWLRKVISAKFPAVFIDEYQDLGPALHEIVKLLLATESTRIIAVGDPDQSIYGFQGAQPDLLYELADMDGVGSVRLKLNYRSRRAIVRGALTVLQEQRDYEPTSSEEGLVYFVECPLGLEQEAAVILEQILPAALAAPQRELGDVVVLYNDRNVGSVIARACREKGMRYIRIDAGGPYPRAPTTRWLEECAAWCAGEWQSERIPLSSIIRRWRTLTRSRIAEGDRRQIEIDLVYFLMTHRDGGAPVGTWLGALNDSVLNRLLETSEFQEDEAETLRLLLEATKGGGTIVDWTVSDLGVQTGSADVLNLMTLHSCKGLEFDVVVMMGMDEGRIPPYRAGPGGVRESRRLFYVGMTRARHEVHLTYSGFTVNRGGRWDNGPSRFVLELQEAR